MARFILSAFADEIADDLKSQMEVLEKYDIRFIEMRGVNGKPLVQHTLKEVKELKKSLGDRDFGISAIGSPIGKIDIRDAFGPHLELFRHTLEIASQLETRFIRMFSFFIPENQEAANYRNQVLERWNQFVKAAEGTGIVLLHENEKDIYGDIPERCLDLINQMNCSYVKAAFDPANFVQCDAETYPDAYNQLKDHTVHLHIKDALYADHSVVPAGCGDGKIPELLREFMLRGYDGFLTLEPHLQAFTGLASLERNVEFDCRKDDGEGKFHIAVEALKKVLREIGYQ